MSSILRSTVLRFFFNPRYPLTLLILFVMYAIAWGIHPVDRKDWMLENALTALFVAFLIFPYGRFPLSNVSYTLICRWTRPCRSACCTS